MDPTAQQPEERRSDYRRASDKALDASVSDNNRMLHELTGEFRSFRIEMRDRHVENSDKLSNFDDRIRAVSQDTVGLRQLTTDISRRVFATETDLRNATGPIREFVIKRNVERWAIGLIICGVIECIHFFSPVIELMMHKGQ